MSENIKININMPNGTIQYTAGSVPENFDASAFENIDWADAYDKAEKMQDGSEAVEFDSLINAAFDGNVPQGAMEILSDAFSYINEGDSYFADYDDIANLNDVEQKYLDEGGPVEYIPNNISIMGKIAGNVVSKGIEALNNAAREVNNIDGNSNEKDNAQSVNLLQVDKLGEKLKQENGKNYIEVDSWNANKNDNMDCMSRIIYNAYGVNPYSEEGQKVYEALKEANEGFDDDFEKTTIHPGDKVFLPDVADVSQENAKTNTDEEGYELATGVYMTGYDVSLVEGKDTFENVDAKIMSGGGEIDASITRDEENTYITLKQEDEYCKTYNNQSGLLVAADFKVTNDLNSGYQIQAFDANGGIVNNDSARIEYNEDGTKNREIFYSQGKTMRETNSYYDDKGKLIRTTIKSGVDFDNIGIKTNTDVFKSALCDYDESGNAHWSAESQNGLIYDYDNDTKAWGCREAGR